jgi:phage shock protein E
MTNASSAITKSALFAFAFFLQLSYNAAVDAAASDITQRQLIQRLDMHEAPLILDVRRPDEFAAGHVPGAINIPHTELDQHLHELGSNLNIEIVVYCESGRRAAIAAGILEKAGFTNVLHLEGDMKSWRERKLPTVMVEPQSKP